jgi:hypothetical protein
MARKTFETTALIVNTPRAVIDYVADVRNRPLFFPSLKSITDIKGDPSAQGTTWKWTFVALGVEVQGTGRCLRHDPGKLYSFQTEGGVASTFTYTAVPEGNGTRLTISLEYDLPESLPVRLPAEHVRDAMKKAEAERVIQNLKTVLDQ